MIVDEPYAGFGVNLKKDIVSLFLMALPQSTAFLFTHVPEKKGVNHDGFTIWKEYRWHAFIFGTRSLSLLTYYVLQAHFFPIDDTFTKGVRIATVYTTMFAAKTVTDWYPKQSSTIRVSFIVVCHSCLILLYFLLTNEN